MKKPFSNNKAAMTLYSDLLAGIKSRIRQAQNRAVMSANAEMLCLYWDIGRMVAIKQDAEGWGTAVIPRLAVDLCNDLPEIKGFSERNIGRMIAFFRAYPDMDKILPQPMAKLNQKPKQVVTDLPQAAAKHGIPPQWSACFCLFPRFLGDTISC